MGKPLAPLDRLRRRQGDDLYQLRKAAGFSQDAFGKLIGVTAGAVSQWECGRTSPRPTAQLAIARTLGANPFAIDEAAA